MESEVYKQGREENKEGERVAYLIQDINDERVQFLSPFLQKRRIK